MDSWYELCKCEKIASDWSRVSQHNFGHPGKPQRNIPGQELKIISNLCWSFRMCHVEIKLLGAFILFLYLWYFVSFITSLLWRKRRETLGAQNPSRKSRYTWPNAFSAAVAARLVYPDCEAEVQVSTDCLPLPYSSLGPILVPPSIYPPAEPPIHEVEF